MVKKIVYAYVLDGQGGTFDATKEEINNGKSDRGILWLHLNREFKGIHSWLSQHFHLHKSTLDALLVDEVHPRFYQNNGNVLLILRGVNMNQGAIPEDMISIRLWTNSEIIITLGGQMIMALKDIIADLHIKNGVTHAAQFISSLTYYMLVRIGDVIDNIEIELDDEEENLFSKSYADRRVFIMNYRLRCSRLRRYIVPQKEALTAMLHSNCPFFADDFKRSMLENIDRTSRYIENLEFTREQAILLSEANAAHLSEKLNKNTYILSVVAVLFLPLGFFTGLFGVNLTGIPLADSYWSFGLFTLLIIILFFAEYAFLKWKKWL